MATWLTMYKRSVVVFLVLVVWVTLAAPVTSTYAVQIPEVDAFVGSVVIATQVPAQDEDELERGKLREEIRQLEILNARSSGILGWLLALAPFLTVVVGVVSLAGALIKQSHDLREDRREAERQADQWRAEFRRQQDVEAAKAEQWRHEFVRLREQDAEARNREAVRRFDERLTQVASDLGSADGASNLVAAATLGLFVKDRYSDLHTDLLNLIIAAMKSKPTPPVADIMRGHLSSVLRLIFREGRQAASEFSDRLDLTRMDLYRLNISGLNLPDTVTLDVAYSRLNGANLRDVRAFRARGFQSELNGTRFTGAYLNEARFNRSRAERSALYLHDADLVSSTFEDAIIPRAEFQRARLQGAKLRRATLTAARFEGANLADTYFDEAVLDLAALRSIALGANNWRQAHFEADVLAQLERISSSGGQP